MMTISLRLFFFLLGRNPPQISMMSEALCIDDDDDDDALLLSCCAQRQSTAEPSKLRVRQKNGGVCLFVGSRSDILLMFVPELPNGKSSIKYFFFFKKNGGDIVGQTDGIKDPGRSLCACLWIDWPEIIIPVCALF